MNWESVTLDKLGSVSRGRSKHRPRNDAILFGGKYPFIQTADVKAAPFYITEYNETYNDKGLAQSKLWHKGTLCITIAANIADTAILDIDACFPDSVMGFIPYDDVSDVRFVKYAFDMLQRDMKQISQGAAQDNLSWQKLSTIRFPNPPIEIQRKIADYLVAYEDLIENNQKQIKLLEEAAQRLYKEWFVDLRFPGYENVKVVDGVPEGWKQCLLGDINCSLESGSRPKGGIDASLVDGVPSIGAENVIGLGCYNYSSEKLITKEFFCNKFLGGIIIAAQPNYIFSTDTWYTVNKRSINSSLWPRSRFKRAIDISQQALLPSLRHTVNNLYILISGEAEIDKPLFVKPLCRFFKQLYLLLVVFDKVFVRHKIISYLSLYFDWRIWKSYC